MDERYPEILRELADKAEAVLVEEGVLPDQAAAVAWKLVEWIRRDWWGEQLYLPKGKAWDLYLRDLEMYREFNGSNYSALSRKHGIGVRQVRNRINLIRAEVRGAGPSLFDEVYDDEDNNGG